nr:EamA family transporter [Sphingomonas sp. SFZ2018-12]
MVVAGIAWGLYSVLGRSAADPARRTAGNFLVAALVAAPLPLLDAGPAPAFGGVALAIASGAFASGLGYVAWYRVVPRLPHATVGAAQLATPVVAALAAAVLLGEPLTVRLAVAAALILGGIAATLRRA